MLKMMAAFVALALAPVAALHAAQPARQAPEPRTLDVPATASWQHAETSLILPPRLAGLRRVSIRDLGQDELDIVASYEGDDGVVATVYLFKTGLPDPSIWFDRALFALHYNLRGRVSAAMPAATPFIPAGRTTGGLLASFNLTAPAGAGTAVALVPATQTFLLKVRMSAAQRNGTQLRGELERLLGAVRWPRWSGEPSAVATVIPPCARPLSLRRAREIRNDPMGGLLNAMIGSTPISRPAGGNFCREPGPTPVRGVYRVNQATTSYFVAIGDSGLALHASPALTLEALEGRRSPQAQTSLTFLDREGSAIFPTYDRLLPPDQALEVWQQGRSTVRIDTGR